jgi:hypothetical protein
MSLTADDFILYKNAENMMSGGYKLNSIFLKNGVSPMQTVNFRKNTLETNLESDSKEAKGKNNISSLFEDLAIPAGLFFNNAKLFSENKIPFEPYKEHSVLPDDIFDKLFKMVEYDATAIKANKYKKTRKGISGSSLIRKGFTKKAKKD